VTHDSALARGIPADAFERIERMARRRLRTDPAFDSKATDSHVTASQLAEWVIEEAANDLSDGDNSTLSQDRRIQQRVKKRLARTVGRRTWWNPFLRSGLLILVRVVVPITMAYLRLQFPAATVVQAAPMVAETLYKLLDEKRNA